MMHTPTSYIPPKIVNLNKKLYYLMNFISINLKIFILIYNYASYYMQVF